MKRFVLMSVCLLASYQTHADDASSMRNFIGLGVWSRPAYDGSDSQRTVAIPMIGYYGQPWFARSTHGLLEGGARLKVSGALTVGMQLAVEGGRTASESAFLSDHNVQTISPGASWGAHTEFKHQVGPMPIWLLARHRRDTNSDHGTQTDLRLTGGVYGGDQLKMVIFVQTTWADRRSMQTYYGITPQQSASTGLPVFTPGSGRLFNSEGLLWSFDVTHDWMLLGSFEARQLQGSVSGSPLVQVSSNHYVSLGIGYQF